MKLTEDQKEALRNLMVSEDWPIVLGMIDQLALRFAQSLQTVSIDRSDRELLIARAKYDGAQALADAIKRMKQELVKDGRREEKEKARR